MQSEILGEEVEESCNKPWFKSHSGGGAELTRGISWLSPRHAHRHTYTGEGYAQTNTDKGGNHSMKRFLSIWYRYHPALSPLG